ncbi:gamma-glutamylcyclotransferase family protein [Actinoplanes sp. NPDC049802]|uniref:gamma-glutamylcyclotransferase family protein n=1 Tax=Actinoplanes sp. NPDC049802 TaxID=3154742 RepID=UPI0033FFA51F
MADTPASHQDFTDADDAGAVQRQVARMVADAMRDAGLTVEIGDYGGFASAEVLGGDGRRVIAVPLYDWDPEDDDARDGCWEYAVRDCDGELLPLPDDDEWWGCPDIWHVAHVGLRLGEGIDGLTEAMSIAGELLGWKPAVAAAGTGRVFPGQSATDYAVDPYPGTRPVGSWVIDQDERCWPVVPDEAMPSGWAVVAAPNSRVCLDTWLTGQGAAPLAGRVPVLSYGSNACPGKVLANMTPLPAVNLACEMEGLASVRCTGGAPVTLASVPKHTETAVVTMATPADLRVLDVVEGRRGGWYTLQTLHTGRVVLENGARVPRPAAYVGARPERHPLLVDGRPVPRTLAAVPSGEGHTGDATVPEPIGDTVPVPEYPSPGECIPAVFVYGTLMPGRTRWHLIADQVTSEPWPARIFGDLRDTGYGYPALTAAADRKAPGVLCSFPPETMTGILTVLDQVEGTAGGLFSRHPRNIGGVLGWVYLADKCAGTGTAIDAW